MHAYLPHTGLISQLTKLATDGGQISPSIYDTCLALYMQPEDASYHTTWDWLLAAQQADGGWGPPIHSRTRTLPTLSAVLALSAHRPTPAVAEAIQAGLKFLEEQRDLWYEQLPDDLPVGSELVLPPLLNAAQSMGQPLDPQPYAQLSALGERRRTMIARRPFIAGTPATHSFEAWGQHAEPKILDGSGGVGHSPAATLRWLTLARQHGLPATEIARAEAYLEAASRATGLDSPGLFPTVWPITRFEQIWGLYVVASFGLLDLPEIRDIVLPQLTQLSSLLDERGGIGMSDHFAIDGDDSVTAVATLLAAGLPADLSVVERFRSGGHFVSYHHELQPSLTTTAHAVHALALAGADVAAPVATLMELQQPDGRWSGDKWHASWLYTTSQVIIALAAVPEHQPGLWTACTAVLDGQAADGGWGGVSETSYALMSLIAIQRTGHAPQRCIEAIARGAKYLAGHALEAKMTYTPGWIGKELYAPYRIDQIWSFVALIAAHRLLEETIDQPDVA